MKDYNKNKASPYLNYWDVINLYQWPVLQKLPLGGFKCVEDKYEFNKDFM